MLQFYVLMLKEVIRGEGFGRPPLSASRIRNLGRFRRKLQHELYNHYAVTLRIFPTERGPNLQSCLQKSVPRLTTPAPLR